MLASVLLATIGATPAVAGQTITDIVASSGDGFDHNGRDYDILLTAVVTADLAGALADESASLTVFAPNDAAFIRTARDLGFKGRDEEGAWLFLVDTLTDLGGGDPVPVLTDILLYHVAPQRIDVFGFFVAAIFDLEVGTLQGGELEPFLFGLKDAEPDLRNPRLTFPISVDASNGVIHTINRVLIPLDLP